MELIPVRMTDYILYFCLQSLFHCLGSAKEPKKKRITSLPLMSNILKTISVKASATETAPGQGYMRYNILIQEYHQSKNVAQK